MPKTVWLLCGESEEKADAFVLGSQIFVERNELINEPALFSQNNNLAI